MDIQISPFQRSVLSVPEEYDLFLGGGRGGAKSWSLALLAWRHCEQYKDKARVLYLRQSYKGVADFEQITRDLFGQVYGTAARFNAHEKVWRLPGGGYFEIGQLESVGDYGKYQGRSFSLVMVDESSQYPDASLLDKLRSNLRGPADLPLRMVLAANPGEVGHVWCATRYALKGVPWVPFLEEKSGGWWVSCPSTYLDNPFIDQQSYRRQLESSVPGDPELLSAWLSGNWAIKRGAFFAGCLDESRNAIAPWVALPDPPHRRYREPSGTWQYYLAHDFGSSAPSVTYLCGRSPGAQGPDRFYYPRDSLVLVDELATFVPGSVNEGLRWPVDKLAEAIIEFCESWKVEPTGAADDAIFAQAGHSGGSLAEEFARNGVRFQPARKADRRTGWLKLQQLLVDAGKPDKPGMYISRRCEYFWATVPFLARDPRRPDDVDSRGPDHGADAARYAVLYQPTQVSMQRLLGV